MDLRFTRRFVYPAPTTINMWGYYNWTEMSHKRQYARDTNLMITNTITYIVAYLPYLDDLGSDRQTSMKF